MPHRVQSPLDISWLHNRHSVLGTRYGVLRTYGVHAASHSFAGDSASFSAAPGWLTGPMGWRRRRAAQSTVIRSTMLPVPIASARPGKDCIDGNTGKSFVAFFALFVL